MKIEIPDTVWVELQALAARRGCTPHELAAAFLRLGVASALKAARPALRPKKRPPVRGVLR